MKVYIKNETNLLKGTKNLNKKLKESYYAEFSTGLYVVEIVTMEAFNMLVRDIVKVMGSTSVYPFITPFEGSIQINLRLMDFGSKTFK